MVSLKDFVEFACIAFSYTVAFIGAFHCSTLFVFYLLLTPLFPLAVAYLIFAFFTWSSPRRGGRAVGSQFMKRLPIFRYAASYFPISLVKTAELNPENNFIFGYHPHAVAVEGAVYSLATEVLGFSEKFPGITPHLSVLKHLTSSLLYRELLMSLGIIEVSREGLEYALTKMGQGHSVVIVVGGAREAMETRAGTYDFIIEKRKGFIRLALETGASLVPVIGFGQNDTHFVTVGRRGTWFGDWQRNNIRLNFPTFWFVGRFGSVIAKRTPIHVVVGAPLAVQRVEKASKEQVDELHAKYKEKLRQLFYENKAKFGIPESTRLNFY